MSAASPLLPLQMDTVAELRDLYRAAEARAARLRMLSDAGRDLASARADTIDDQLDACARRIARFAGLPDGRVHRGADGPGIEVHAPGDDGPTLATLDIRGLASLDDIADVEDRDAVRVHLQMLGATIDRIDRDAERLRLLDTLQERERRLEYVVGRLFNAQEEERRRVSRDLHDGVAQQATALFRLLEASAGTGNSAADANSARLSAIARDLVQELRTVIAGLRPTILDDLGLGPAIRALAAGLEEDGYTVALSLDGDTGSWPVMHETAFYRVAQEAVANIRKHAGGPCGVRITLSGSDDGSGRQLVIRDQGQGRAPAQSESVADHGAGQHIGIAVMRERVTAIGGRLDWRWHPDGGVEIVASTGR